MLRIEKKPKKGELGVSLKIKGSLINPTLLAAFAIALSLHFSAFLIFEVSPIQLRHADRIFHPVQVKIDFLPAIDSDVLAELENAELAREAIPPPAKSKPVIQDRLPVKIVRSHALPKVTEMTSFPFNDFHSQVYSEECINLAPTPPAPGPLITIRPSGALAERKYSLVGMDRIPFVDPVSGGNGFKKENTAFKVKIDNRTGKVFWHQKTSEGEKRKTLDQSQRILAALQFEKNGEEFLSEGEIEIEYLSRIKVDEPFPL